MIAAPLVKEHRSHLAGMGFETLPITPGTKVCPVDNWSTAPIWRTWADYGQQAADLAIRLGTVKAGPGGERLTLAAWDADEKTLAGSIAKSERALRLLGVGHGDTVTQLTRNAGRHWLLWLRNAPEVGSVAKFDTQHGIAGELRHGPGAYVLITPSAGYHRIAGYFDELAIVDFDELAELLEKPAEPAVGQQESRSEAGQVDTVRLLAMALERAELGSRHNSGLWLACACRDNGIAQDDAAAIMADYQKRVPQAGHWYKAREAAATLRSVYKRTPRQPWAGGSDKPTVGEVLAQPGMFTGNDAEAQRDVLLAHLGLRYAAIKAGGQAWYASARMLAERAAVGRSSANRITQKLLRAGWLRMVKPAAGPMAATYTTGPRMLEILAFSNWDTRKKENKYTYDPDQSEAWRDVWRWDGMGKTARSVWERLQAGPHTVGELATLTGRAFSTIARNLATLKKWGLAKFDGVKWQVLPVTSWAELAGKLGMLGATQRQRERHNDERLAYREKSIAGKVGEVVQAAAEHFRRMIWDRTPKLSLLENLALFERGRAHGPPGNLAQLEANT